MQGVAWRGGAALVGKRDAPPIDILYERSLSSYRHSIGEQGLEEGGLYVVSSQICASQSGPQGAG